MATTAPTGHQKNVANFEELIAYCTGYGITYNPSNNSLKIAQLQAMHTTGKNVLQVVKTTETTYNNASNALEIAMTPLKKYCTRIINALEATTATKQTVNDVKTINHKIQGKPANGTKTATNTTVASDVPATESQPTQISTTQQSKDSFIDNFQKLVVAVTAEPLYVPYETDLKVAALNTTLTNFKTLNTAVINATSVYKKAPATMLGLFYIMTIILTHIAALASPNVNKS